jgi:RNA polymerase sigma-70 factor (ECF subfamily)
MAIRGLYMGVTESRSAVDAAAAPGLADFADWVAPHWSAMTGLAARLVPATEVEDVVQEALVLAWRKRDRFDPARGTPRTWLLTLTADQARRLRRRFARIPRPVGQLAEPDGADAPPDPDLAHALATLPIRQRLAVELFYYIGLPIKEVALVMGCAEGTVKSTLSDARARLRRNLDGTP